MRNEKNETLLPSFFLFLLGIIILAYVLLTTGCKPVTMPSIDVQFWAADSERSSIVLKSEDAEISCASPDFDQYACLTYEDIQKIWDTMLQCKEWNAEPINTAQARRLVRKNSHIVEKLSKSQKEDI